MSLEKLIRSKVRKLREEEEKKVPAEVEDTEKEETEEDEDGEKKPKSKKTEKVEEETEAEEAPKEEEESEEGEEKETEEASKEPVAENPYKEIGGPKSMEKNTDDDYKVEIDVPGRAPVPTTHTTVTSADVDVSDDVDALVGDEKELTEDFKVKARTILEAAVVRKSNQVIESTLQTLEENYKGYVDKYLSEELLPELDRYLNYVVEQWMSENKLSVESGLKTEITEQFITGMKNLFKENYIEVPEERRNVLEEKETEIKALKAKLNEEKVKNSKILVERNEKTKEIIIKDVSKGLTFADACRLEKLVENVEFKTAKEFQHKVEIIKESYFKPAKPKILVESFEEETLESTPEVSGTMKAYTNALKASL